MAILIMIVALTFSGAITLFLQKDKFFNDISKEENLNDFTVLIPRSNYSDEYENYIINDSRVKEYEKEEVLYMSECENKTINMQLEVQLLDLEAPRAINKFILIDGYTLDECEAHGISKKDALYLPVYFKGMGVDPGDDYVIAYKGNELHFTLAGFFHSAIYGTTNSGSLKFFLSNEGYESVKGMTDEAFLLKATLNDGISVSDEFVNDFRNNTSISAIQSGTSSVIWNSRMIQDNLNTNLYVGVGLFIFMSIASMMIVFAVMYFEITESIRDSYRDIGVLEAMGYYSKQIAASYVIQYGIAAVAGSFVGAMLSSLLCKAIAASVYTKLSGFLCNVRFDPVVVMIGVLATTLICIIFVLFPIRKVKKCTILTALRGGIETHSFKSDHFPLHKGSSNVNTRIGLKNLFTEKRQNLMIGSVVFLCMMLIGLTTCIYNTFKDGKSIINNVAIETSDIQAIVGNGADTEKMITEITALPEFRKALCSEQKTVAIDGRDLICFVTDDYSKLETVKIMSGDPPVYEDEIALSDRLCKILGKDIGDKVTVSVGGVKTECYITGKTPFASNGGMAGYANTSLMKLLINDYKPSSIDLYFSDGVTEEQAIAALSRKYKIADTDKLSGSGAATENASDEKYSEAEKIAEEKIALLLSEYGFTDVSYSVVLGDDVILSGNSNAYMINKIENVTKKYQDMLVQYTGVFGIVSLMMAIMSVMLTAGILSMLVRNRVNKKYSEYGTFKAMGYTASDLIKQNALSYAVSALAGTILGVIAVFASAQKLVGSFFELLLGARLPICVDYVIITGAGVAMVAFVFGLSLLCSRKIKNISVYDLMTE